MLAIASLGPKSVGCLRQFRDKVYSQLQRIPKVCVVIVNWNRWQDTIECLESVFRLNYRDFTVWVCDNASSDNSLERIEEWAKGDRAAVCGNPELEHLTVPPFPKPIPLTRAVRGDQSWNVSWGEKLVLCQAVANLGFAGGNNAVLRLLPSAGDYDYVWFLNNDTVVDPEALGSLVEKMETDQDAGICGSTLLRYNDPRTVQALGGSIYNRWTARGGDLGAGCRRNLIPQSDWVEQRMKYVVGASMLVRRRFLEEIGPMSERYFLYFEELDWATRAGKRFRLRYCPDSIVYHKEGTTVGTARQPENRSILSEFYATRNRVVFTLAYFPYAVVSVCAAILTSALHRLLLGNRDGFKAVLRGFICGFRESLPIVRNRITRRG